MAVLFEMIIYLINWQWYVLLYAGCFRARPRGSALPPEPGIGSVNLLGVESNEAMKRASEEKCTALLFQSAVGAPRRPAPPATAQTSRFLRGQRAHARRGKFVPLNFAPARKSTKPPMAAPAPHRYVKVEFSWFPRKTAVGDRCST